MTNYSRPAKSWSWASSMWSAPIPGCVLLHLCFLSSSCPLPPFSISFPNISQDKKLESWIKDRGFAGGGRNRPTVTSPKEYKSRFREAMNRYILQAPTSWQQFPGMEGSSRMSSGPGTPATLGGSVGGMGEVGGLVERSRVGEE